MPAVAKSPEGLLERSTTQASFGRRTAPLCFHLALGALDTTLLTMSRSQRMLQAARSRRRRTPPNATRGRSMRVFLSAGCHRSSPASWLTHYRLQPSGRCSVAAIAADPWMRCEFGPQGDAYCTAFLQQFVTNGKQAHGHCNGGPGAIGGCEGVACANSTSEPYVQLPDGSLVPSALREAGTLLVVDDGVCEPICTP